MSEPAPLPRMPAPGDSAAEAAASFHLQGRALRVVCVDDLVPRHEGKPGQPRPRLVYLPGEIAHFDLDHHRYALLPEPVPCAAEPGAPEPGAMQDIAARLTNRELQIVQLICMGLLTKQVADRLRISEFTVRSYLKTIYCKLGVRSRGAMVFAYAQSFGRGRASDGSTV